MPEQLIRWLNENVPETKHGRAIVFSRSASLIKANGTTSIGKKLQKKGYQVVGQYTYRLPRNFYFTNYEPTDEIMGAKLFKDAKESIVKDFESVGQLAVQRLLDKTLNMDLLAKMMGIMT